MGKWMSKQLYIQNIDKEWMATYKKAAQVETIDNNSNVKRKCIIS